MIYLLKSRSDDAEVGRPDPYEEIFGANMLFVPILRFRPFNIPALIETLTDKLEFHDALIVTSQRAVDSLKIALTSLDNIESLVNRPVYTVGPTTASRLKTLGFKDVRGEESGTGKLLAKSILNETTVKRRFLFLAGEVHRAELPNQLSEAGNDVQTQVVYRSEPTDYRSQLRTIKDGDWMVFFSPSHSLAAVELAKTRPSVRVAAIGPTTKSFLDENQVAVSAMAPKPSPEALASAICDKL